MGTIGTFDTFTTARLGIYAAQKGLSVTGNNIANINTGGYTRQRLDQVSLKTGANDMYRSMFDNHVGSGTLVTGISQIRDPYLDIRFRNTNADVGYYDEKLSGLQNVASILDEVGKGENYGDGLLYAQIQDLADALRAISSDPNKDNDTLARTSADALVSLFNTYAGKLENLRQDYIDSLNQDIAMVNDILTNIRNLNESIRESDVHGDPALEMRDERNRQIDALSEYMHIKVTYSMERIGGGIEVEKCTIALAGDNPERDVTTDSSILIDGIYGTQISVPEKLPVPNPNYDPAAAAENKNKLLKDENAVLDPNGFRYLDADGVPTDSIDEAAMADNDNLLVNISKLLNAGGEEWTNSVTKWEELDSGSVGVKAKYTYEVKSSGWKPPDEIVIGDKKYTVGVDISAAEANDPAKMAAFIAGCLDGTDKYKDYFVRSNGNKIIFTAKNPGVVPGAGGDDGAPTEVPGLTLDDGGGKITLGERKTVREGETWEPPDDPDWPGTVTYNADGTMTSVRFVEGEKGWLKCTVTTEYTSEVTLADNDLHGSLQATRELLTVAGEFATSDVVANIDKNAATKRGIPYYQKSLDLLARTFAEQYNRLNQGYMFNQNENYIYEDGSEVMLNGEAVNKGGLTKEQLDYVKNDPEYSKFLDGDSFDTEGWLASLYEAAENDPTLSKPKKPEGSGVLFSNSNDGDDTNEITASNISVSSSWSHGDVQIVATFRELFGQSTQYDDEGNPLPNTTQNENVNHMLSLINASLLYNPKDMVPDAVGTKLFQGSFNDMFSNMCIVLGNDQRTTSVKLNSQYTSLIEIDSNRDGVSGVDLNDEAMNMMTYQKAYSAACRLMTAIDEALDRLINNTGIAGR